MAKKKFETRIKNKVALLESLEKKIDDYQREIHCNPDLIKVLRDNVKAVEKEVLSLTRTAYGSPLDSTAASDPNLFSPDQG